MCPHVEAERNKPEDGVEDRGMEGERVFVEEGTAGGSRLAAGHETPPDKPPRAPPRPACAQFDTTCALGANLPGLRPAQSLDHNGPLRPTHPDLQSGFLSGSRPRTVPPQRVVYSPQTTLQNGLNPGPRSGRSGHLRGPDGKRERIVLRESFASTGMASRGDFQFKDGVKMRCLHQHWGFRTGSGWRKTGELEGAWTQIHLYSLPSPVILPSQAGKAGRVLGPAPNLETVAVPCLPSCILFHFPRIRLPERAQSCLGGEQEANFRHGDSLPTAAAAGPRGALDTALQVCSEKKLSSQGLAYLGEGKCQLQATLAMLSHLRVGSENREAPVKGMVHQLTKKLQTGMRGAFGKPQGTVARVHIGQVIMSIRTKLQNKEHVIEALRRAKFKFPGRQKIHISKKWGFTKFNADEFENMVAEKRLIPDGCGVKYIPNRGPLDKWWALHS
nr:PREDICTED: uncharacterized protein LOC102275613 [Bos mutus]